MFPTAAVRRRLSAAMGRSAGSRMQAWFPGTAQPLVVSAPMLGVANAGLAAAVSRAGGLGFLQHGKDCEPGHPSLRKLDEELRRTRELLLAHDDDGGAAAAAAVLPVGVGFITYAPSLAAHFAATVVPILARHRPAVAWLFAPDPQGAAAAEKASPHASVVQALHQAGAVWGLRVAVQVGTVAAARRAAADGADIVVVQGTDAGGHQWARGASIVALVPEIVDMLRDEFPDREIAVWAAGGLVEGRGIAAALALGAEGVVMGTRFMAAAESAAPEYKRQTLVATVDGAENTAKSQFHDHVQGNHSWPALYDGRGVVTAALRDHEAGVPLAENVEKHKAAQQAGDVSRAVTWSGTGVGLIKDVRPAGEIVEKVRADAQRILGGLQSKI